MKFQGPGKLFSFFGGERAGILVLLALAFVFALLPRLIWNSSPPSKPTFTSDSAEIASLLAAQKHLEDSFAFRKYKGKKNLYHSSVEELMALGFTKDAATKVKAKVQSGGIKNYDELSAISGMDSQQLARIFYTPGPKKTAKETRFTPENPLELNAADSTDLASFPGIGAKTASRIIHFRDLLGGFYTVNQVLETRWVDTNALKPLLGSMRVSTAGLRKIDPLKSSVEELARHPYLSKKEATLIAAFCRQHQYFRKQDLKNHPAISATAKQKLQYYLIFTE